MKIRQKLQLDRSLLRPMLYQLFTRAVIGLTAVLLWEYLVRRMGRTTSRPTAFLVAALFCGIMAWAAWLRLDGMRLLRVDRKLFRRKRKNSFPLGDMADYVDEDIVSYDDLTDEEKDSTLLFSNAIACVLFLIASFF